MRLASSRKMELWVGTFILVSMAMLFFLIVFMAGQKKVFADKYQLRAIFRDVQGLRAGAPVMLAGLQCGSVKSIEFTPDGNLLVTLQIRKEFQSQIREDSVASIGTIGLLGDKSVEITSGSRDSPIVREGGFLKTQASMTFAEVLNRARPAFEALSSTLINLKAITDQLVGTQGDLQAATRELRGILEKVNRGQGSVGKFITQDEFHRAALEVMEQAGQVMEQMRDPRGTLGALITDRRLYDQTLASIEEMGRAIGRMKQWMEGMEPLMKEARGGVGEGRAAMEDLRRILKRVEAASRSLELSMKRLPVLMREAEAILRQTRGALTDARAVIRAAQSHWLIRSYMERPEQEEAVFYEPR